MKETPELIHACTRLDALVDTERDLSVAALRQYYGATSRYEGRLFDGYRTTDPEQIEPADLLSLSLLGMGETLPRLVEAFENPTTQNKAAAYLRDIPTDVYLHEAPEVLINDQSAAAGLWNLVASIGRNRWVTAYKLCARKRPNLLPISDSQVSAYLGMANTWDSMWLWLQNRPNAAQDVHRLRNDSGVGNISLLRTLDVPMWMKQTGNVGRI